GLCPIVTLEQEREDVRVKQYGRHWPYAPRSARRCARTAAITSSTLSSAGQSGSARARMSVTRGSACSAASAARVRGAQNSAAAVSRGETIPASDSASPRNTSICSLGVRDRTAARMSSTAVVIACSFRGMGKGRDLHPILSPIHSARPADPPTPWYRPPQHSTPRRLRRLLWGGL